MSLKNLKKRLLKTASNSNCTYKIGAVAISKKGNILGYAINKKRFVRKGGGIHAECELFKKFKNKIDTIYIVRVNKTGNDLPIKACKNCKKIALRYNTKIINL